MTSSAISSSPARAGNPWVVAAIVVVPTFMEVLDTTIAVVALRYIAGGLSATVADGEWVLTSYLAGQRRHPAHLRLAERPSGPPAVFSAVDRDLHPARRSADWPAASVS